MTKHTIDLRSDTLTQPTAGMRDAMFAAPLGDDVFNEDPTVLALQEKASHLFGMEDALFCPSGTMTNQIAIRLHTRPQDEVICDHNSHIYRYEGGGVAYNSLASLRLLQGDRGRITAKQVEANINPDDIHFPVSRLVSLENTMNKGGGCYYDLNEIRAIRKVCDAHGLALHLDGARLFNALAETRDTPSSHGMLFDTISICLSKGLGAPVGSLLLGTKEHIKQARRIRKVLGGGMRQAGFLAAAGIYALDYHRDRLVEDHARARQLGQALEGLNWVSSVMPVDTNIVIFSLSGESTAADGLERLEAVGIKAVPFGPQEIRLVTHLDFDDDQLSQCIERLQGIRW